MAEVYSRRYGHHSNYYPTDEERDAAINELIKSVTEEKHMEAVQGLAMKSLGQFKLLVTSTFDNQQGVAVHQVVIAFDEEGQADTAAVLIVQDTDFHGHVTKLYVKSNT